MHPGTLWVFQVPLRCIMFRCAKVRLRHGAVTPIPGPAGPCTNLAAHGPCMHELLRIFVAYISVTQLTNRKGHPDARNAFR